MISVVGCSGSEGASCSTSAEVEGHYSSMSCLGGGGPGRRGAVHDWYRILQLPKNRCWTLGSSNTSARENSAAAAAGWSGRRSSNVKSCMQR